MFSPIRFAIISIKTAAPYILIVTFFLPHIASANGGMICRTKIENIIVSFSALAIYSFFGLLVLATILGVVKNRVYKKLAIISLVGMGVSIFLIFLFPRILPSTFC